MYRFSLEERSTMSSYKDTMILSSFCLKPSRHLGKSRTSGIVTTYLSREPGHIDITKQMGANY